MIDRPAMQRFALLVGLTFVAVGCRSEPVNAADAETTPASDSRTLRSFGAAGDGRSNDTDAVQQALATSDGMCLDGEGKTYAVTGTLRVSKDLCLRNATLVQKLVPYDTSRFLGHACPVTEDVVAVADCGDPPVPADELTKLGNSLAVRTLLIRPEGNQAPLHVSLDHVKIDRGRFAYGGSRTDSAGIWLEGADKVDFRDVEITGNGKGHGLLLIRSRNITLTNLSIHDMVWAPDRGDAPLTEARVAATGWNSVPIHEFRSVGQDNMPVAKFYGVRIQEQISCLTMFEVQHVRINNLQIARCMAQFDTGNIPWQADGFAIGLSSSDIVINGGTIDSTWEGIDVAAGGTGVEGLVINDLTIRNSFGFGLKLGVRVRNAQVSRLAVSKAGLAGIVIYGPVNGVHVSGATIDGVGVVRGAKGDFSPWKPGARAGVRVDEGGGGLDGEGRLPRDVTLDDVTVSTAGLSSNYEFGFLNNGGPGVRAMRLNATGYRQAKVHENGVDR